MPDRVRFYFRGQVRELTDVSPIRSVLHWLREDESQVGTKEGCNQGDCGACTVALAERSVDGIRLRTANACLLPVPLLHGRALFTVEDLAQGDSLHPVQQAMVDTGGSQCGFCTPGFVMSMWVAAERSRADRRIPERDEIVTSLSGNLCRCTGYRPILDAATGGIAEVVARDVTVIPWVELSTVLASLDEPGRLTVSGHRGTYVAPDDELDLLAALVEYPNARILAGGTDAVLTMRSTGEHLSDTLTVVSLDRVSSLAQIEVDSTHLTIGAGVTLEDAWQELVRRAPDLARMWQRFASPAIRATGTIGGNIANGSPIADTTPVLIALDARLHLRDSIGERIVALADFHTGVRASILRPGELITRIEIPLVSFDRSIIAYKVSRRFDDDISTVSAVFSFRLDAHILRDVHVCFGGMATTVRRAPKTEAALEGLEWSEESLRRATESLAADYQPISDHRASAAFRSSAAANLLRRWWLETSALAPSAPLDVWTYS